jgi:hypothetical protein
MAASSEAELMMEGQGQEGHSLDHAQHLEHNGNEE